MKTMVLMEKNERVILGMLKKFFNNPKFGYIMYHNFNCGFKNIKPFGDTLKDYQVDAIDISTSKLSFSKGMIELTLQQNVRELLFERGSRFLFKGSEIIIQKRWKFGFDYIYTVFRLISLTDAEKREIDERRCFEECNEEEDGYSSGYDSYESYGDTDYDDSDYADYDDYDDYDDFPDYDDEGSASNNEYFDDLWD